MRKYTRETEIGRRFGRLVVIDFTPSTKRGEDNRARVACNCGSEPYEVGHTTLVRAVQPVRSCGCWQKENPWSKHGLLRLGARHPYYFTAMNAIRRCRPNFKEHRYYYDRGIRCAWSVGTVADMVRYLAENLPPKQPEQSLDRIDNDRGYEPGNLRWATQKEQIANTRPKIRSADVEPWRLAHQARIDSCETVYPAVWVA